MPDLFSFTLVGAAGSVTFTLTEAVLLPATVLTPMVAVPAPTAVTTPSRTVATPSLLLAQRTLWLASAGDTAASSVSVSPADMFTVPDLFSFTLLGATTVTFTVALRSLSVNTPMVQEPAFTGVTAPLASTVAILALEVFQVRSAVAPEGVSVALSFRVSPRPRVTVPVRSSATPVGLTAGAGVEAVVPELPDFLYSGA